jgi:hypothetical protein
MVNLLRSDGVQETDIARFVRHDPGAANLNRFYVANDFGQAVSEVMDSLVKRSDSKVCYMVIQIYIGWPLDRYGHGFVYSIRPNLLFSN